MRGRRSSLIGLGIALLGALQPAFAVRYEAVRVDELTGDGTNNIKEIRAINNLGDIVGISGEDQAVLLRQVSTDNNRYTNVDADHYVKLPSPVGAIPKSSVAVDLTNAKVSTKGAITIVGTYIDQTDLRHAIYWDKIDLAPNSPFIPHDLKPWEPKPLDPTVPDREARAVSISNNGVIIGTSYDVAGNPRPVVWAKGTVTENGKDVTRYIARDLRAATTISAGIGGEAIGMDKDGENIAGLLKRAGSSFFDPVVWSPIPKISDFFQVSLPVPLPKDQDRVSGENYVAPKEQFERGAVVTTFGVTVGGWYELLDSVTGLSVPKPISWFEVSKTYPDKDAHAPVYRAFPLETLNGIDGKILAVGSANGGDYIGQSNGRGMIITAGCGAQDVNALLTKPLDLAVIERLSSIAQGTYPAMLVGESGTGPSRIGYLLRPAPIPVDIAASIRADHDRIAIGQRHSYTVTVTNKSVTEANKNNRATCINIRVETVVFVPTDGSQKLGGMTFLSATSDKAECNISVIAVTCTAPNLEPGESIDIVIDSEARPLLADRVAKTSVVVYPSETDPDQNVTPAAGDPPPDFNTDNSNNTASVLVSVDRESCFIATAAYGSYLDPHVAALREFRDTYLKSNWVGRQLVSGYYAVSPSMAEYLLDHPELKPWVRVALTPGVVTVEHPAETLFGTAAFVMLVWRIRARRRI